MDIIAPCKSFVMSHRARRRGRVCDDAWTLDTVDGGLDQSNKTGQSYPLKAEGIDLVGGATHWVSPVGLSAEGYTKSGNTCDKGVAREGFSMCFPKWTMRPHEPNVDTVDVAGVEQIQFMFFTGVRY